MFGGEIVENVTRNTVAGESRLQNIPISFAYKAIQSLGAA